jgi:predicted amidohydrolase
MSFGNKAKNLRTIHSFARHAAEAKIDLVIFPELTVTG